MVLVGAAEVIDGHSDAERDSAEGDNPPAWDTGQLGCLHSIMQCVQVYVQQVKAQHVCAVHKMVTAVLQRLVPLYADRAHHLQAARHSVRKTKSMLAWTGCKWDSQDLHLLVGLLSLLLNAPTRHCPSLGHLCCCLLLSQQLSGCRPSCLHDWCWALFDAVLELLAALM